MSFCWFVFWWIIMECTDTCGRPCCSICLDGWCLTFPSWTNTQRCPSRFVSLLFLLLYRQETIQLILIYTIMTWIKYMTLTIMKCLLFPSSSFWLTIMSAAGSTTACLTDGLILGSRQKRSCISLVNWFGGSLNLWPTRWVRSFICQYLNIFWLTHFKH